MSFRADIKQSKTDNREILFHDEFDMSSFAHDFMAKLGNYIRDGFVMAKQPVMSYSCKVLFTA
jgi:hypothetical protein